MSTRKWVTVLVAGGLSAGLGIWASTRLVRARNDAPPAVTSEPPAVSATSTTGARHAERPPFGLAPVPAPTVAQPSEAPLPRNLSEVTMTSALTQGLKDWVEKWDGNQQAVANLNYKLERLADVDACAHGRVQSSGYLDIGIHFEPDPSKPGRLVARSYDVQGSNLPDADRKIALECIEGTVTKSEVVAVNDENARLGFFAPSRFRFPVPSSGIYAFLESGDIRYLSRGYDANPRKLEPRQP